MRGHNISTLCVYLPRGVHELLVDVCLGVELVGDLAEDTLLHAAVEKRVIAALFVVFVLWLVARGQPRVVRTTPVATSWDRRESSERENGSKGGRREGGRGAGQH